MGRYRDPPPLLTDRRAKTWAHSVGRKKTLSYSTKLGIGADC